MGPLGSLGLLGADGPSASVDLRGEAGVLGGQNRPGSLALRPDRDRQERDGGHHGGAAMGTGAGVRSLEPAEIRLC